MHNEVGIRDLIPNIFLCLPIESLVRFKCVNKECNQIISNPGFVADHAIRDPSKPHGLFYFPHSNPGNVIYIPLYSQQKPNYFSAFPSIEASCNGLFLHVPSQTPQFFTVFNPTTKKFQLILRPKGYNNYPLSHNKHNLGLAYDPILFSWHDYKVVHIFVIDLDLIRGNQVYGFEIFSSSLNSWKMSKSRLRCLSGQTYQTEAVYLDGILHWIRECGDIVAFNVKTEDARIIPMPHTLRLKMIEYQNRKPWFGLAKGLVSVVYLSRSEFVVWVLHDYDNCKWGCVRIHIPSLSSRKDLYVIFFDGEWVVFRGRDRGSVISMYNVKSNKWKKIEASYDDDDDDDDENEDVYIPFIPTIVEMSTTLSTADHSINYLISETNEIQNNIYRNTAPLESELQLLIVIIKRQTVVK
ncbi:putative F-box/kelch-repeat protein At1g20790 [Durio zibethinus]|uniref:F-box/kelch-repeat protein At1g20790 n=1 Tax=Durio zibethinus TaxID=66656 RepID=A0A6P6AZD5_DURZI|nr:putative F-box/kelch-repeat protein At1g20790 [Durio zibethinus]